MGFDVGVDAEEYVAVLPTLAAATCRVARIMGGCGQACRSQGGVNQPEPGLFCQGGIIAGPPLRGVKHSQAT